jgi:photosystem II stability/assembly factor-like uncharacterized protein
MNWISASRGWVLGTERCGAKYGNCRGSQVIGTINGGKTWHLVGKLTASIRKIGQGGYGITEIRFGTGKAGWAFGPDLYRTADGGKTWKRVRVPGAGKQVLDLAVTATSVHVIASPCGIDAGICKGKLTGDGGAGFNDISYVSNKVAWVVGSPASMFPAKGKLLKSTDAGRHWHFVPF